MPKYRSEEFLIPEQVYVQEDYFRIELGISLNHQRKEISETIRKGYCMRGFYTIDEDYKKFSWAKLVNRQTVLDYLLGRDVSLKEVEEFFKLVSDVEEQISLDDKFYALAEQKQRAIQIFLACRKHPRILIETGGMYYTALQLTYLIIKKYIMIGGSCIEIAYPHFETNDELGHLIKNTPGFIKLGEMKIK